jgi:2-methylcitrate dehydratase PrpD
LRICNILNPTTGLEGKFSLRFTAAMAMLGENTGVIANYNEQKVQDPEIVSVRDKISVHVNDDLGLAEADVVIAMKDGTVHKARGDVETPDADLDRQWSRLSTKFTDMAAPVIGAAGAHNVIDAVRNLEACTDITEIAVLCGKPVSNDV